MTNCSMPTLGQTPKTAKNQTLTRKIWCHLPNLPLLQPHNHVPISLFQTTITYMENLHDTPEAVAVILTQLDSHKSVCPDGIHNYIHLIYSITSKPLAELFNKFVRHKHHP